MSNLVLLIYAEINIGFVKYVSNTVSFLRRVYVLNLLRSPLTLLYSVIYKAIDEIKEAMEGMLSPDFKEEIVGTAEIRETFKISKIGTIAGCMVTSGKVFRKSNVRLVRDGIVILTTTLSSLKRFQDDVKEVSKGYDCGLQLKNYNDIKIGDNLEFFTELQVKKTVSN